MTLKERLGAQIVRMRVEQRHASAEAWAATLMLTIERHADLGPDQRQEVASLAGITTRPKMISQNGVLAKVTTEQILVTPRGAERGRRG